MRLVYFIMALFALLIVARVLYIQIVQGDHWREQARTTTMRYTDIDAVRGDICADDGRLLATSLPVYDIRMDFSSRVTSDELFYSKMDSLAMQLSRLFGDRSEAGYRSILSSARQRQERYYLLKRGVSHDQLQTLRDFPLFRRGQFGGGLIVLRRSRREMPYKSMAARTIGYEREGIYVGLEGAYREYLEGKRGKRLMQRINQGAWMPINDENEIQPEDGKDLISTINVQIQDITTKALLNQLQQFQAEHGTAVVMEVATGKVKAIANLMRQEDTGRYEETYNFAVGQSTEPGSTFKLPVMMAALEDRVTDPDDFVDTGEGQITYYDRTMSDADDEGYGQITVREAFEVSSNVGVSKIIYDAYSDNPQRFVDRLKQMNLHKPLDLEIAGEGKPILRDTDSQSWSSVSLPWMAIGYEVSLTPLQILAFYNAVANQGRMMKPMFVSEVHQSGQTVKTFQPTVIDRSIAKQSTIRKATQMLQGVVENGTARNIYTDAYSIAGKTGTSQIAQPTRGYHTTAGPEHQASFAGFFPAENPAYSIIVVISKPKGWVYTGNQVAAPVFREIADKIHAAQLFRPKPKEKKNLLAALPPFRSGHLEDISTIYKNYGAHLENQPENSWVRPRIQQDTVSFQEKNFIQNLVPEVVGMGLRDAIYVLENAGMKVRFSGRGTVQRQNIPPGRRIVPGSVIYIELS